MQKGFDIRDPIHGYIRLSPMEGAIVDCAPFQRLRRIGQLGLAECVYPGATHTRFAHALGVMHLAGRLFDHLIAQSPEALRPKGEEMTRLRQLLRLAALLHDVGHSPFSHALEGLFPDDYDHEKMGMEIIRSSEIGEVIAEKGVSLGIAPEDVIDVIRGHLEPERMFLHTVISGELDVDKMDYLLRDSYACGVEYGRYDLERVLYTATLHDGDSGPRIGVQQGGIHAIEAFVLARYYMFTQVYFNPTSKILERHLEEFLRNLSRVWPVSWREFVEHDDVTVWTALRAHPGHPHARRVLSRQHYPLLFETSEHLDEEGEAKFTALFERISSRFEPGLIFGSNATKDPHHFSQTKVYVVGHNGDLEDVTECSSFIGKLKRINQFRVWADEGIASEVKEAFRNGW